VKILVLCCGKPPKEKQVKTSKKLKKNYSCFFLFLFVFPSAPRAQQK